MAKSTVGDILMWKNDSTLFTIIDIRDDEYYIQYINKMFTGHWRCSYLENRAIYLDNSLKVVQILYG